MGFVGERQIPFVSSEVNAMAHIGVLQHFWCENAGVFAETLAAAGHRLTTVALFDGEPVPAREAFDAWLVMGGPMNVDQTQKYPFLEPERELLARLIEADRPVLGICLGAQLLARAAGARVFAQRPKEVGLYPIQLTAAGVADPLFVTLGDATEVFQWHEDTFDLPAAAVHLARSERFAQQAFRIGRRVYGLQFHLECTRRIVDDLCQACANELAELPAEDRFDPLDGRLSASLALQNERARSLILRWAELFD